MIGDIENKEESRKYLLDLKEGRIKLGLGIGCVLDDHLRFNPSGFNVILGHSNVGKTAFVFWYFLMIALKHDKKFLVFSSENTTGSIKRDLIQFLEQEKLKNLSDAHYYSALGRVEHHFDFLEIDHLYTHRILLDSFEKNKDNYDGFLIDPYNSLIKDSSIAGNSHDYDYQASTEIRIFCRKYTKAVYLVAHANTEALRKTYPKGHEYEGFPIPPNAADIEGGGKWVNRADDFIVIHRMTQHPSRWMFTEIHIKKVKDTATGGKPTFLDEPACFRMYNESQFFAQERNGKEIEPLHNSQFQSKKLEINTNFDNEEHDTPF